MVNIGFSEMTFTIKIQCKSTDNAKLISSIVPHIAGLQFNIEAEAEQAKRTSTDGQQVPPLARIEHQPLGAKKQSAFIVYAKYPTDYVSRKQVSEESGLTPEQVRSVTSDAVMRGELVPESPLGANHHRITQRGLDRLRHTGGVQNSLTLHVTES